VPERLAKAQELGAVAVNFAEGDPVEQIFALRKKNRDLRRSPRPGEEKRKGVDCVIDAVGYQARDHKNPEREKPTQVLEDCLRVVNACGHVGIIGAYLSPDPGGDDQNAKQGVFPILLAEAFYKGLTIGTGRTPVKRYNEYLRDLIVARRSKPSTIVSHRIAIKNAPEAYAKFDQHAAGYTKVVISFIVQRQLAA
jgi:glutathione-independent formaldehyde dehydrogenase